MEDGDFAATVEEETNLMEVLEKNLNGLEDNSKNLLESIEQLHLRSDHHLDELASEICKLQENVEDALGPFWQRIKNEMFDAKCYMKEKDKELRKLRVDLENREKALTNMRNELSDAKSTLLHQSSYTAFLGATLCTLLWRACGDKFIAVELLKQKKLVDFLEMVPDSLRSFLESFGEHLPSAQSKEYQFILSVIGIITNIAAVSEGRKFLVSCREGDQIIHVLLEMLAKIPTSDIYIARTILMVLYNVSLDKRGMMIIKNDKCILPLLMKNIAQVEGKLRYVSLRLLQSLAYDVRNMSFLATLIKAIHLINLEEIQQYCTNDEKEMVTRLVGSIESARLRLQNEPGADKVLNGF